MSQTTAPAVSVCIPTYRGAAHIRSAIDSVLAQSWADFELVIIDDNSPDDTAAIVRTYDDPRIRFLQNPKNLGPEGNWNRCLAEARGRYFKLMPQDDMLAVDCLKKQVEILDNDTEHGISLVFCTRAIVDAHNRQIMVRGYPGGNTGVVSADTLIQRCLRRGTNLIGEPGGVMFRTELAKEIGPFDASIPYVLDLDYWFRLLQKGDAFYLSETLASFRISGGSWSVAIGARQSVDYRRFISKTAAKSEFAVRRIDILMGSLMAELNKYLRIVFYKVLLN
jgi:glycosyltransferase involved in cell wall biosynthesis